MAAIRTGLGSERLTVSTVAVGLASIPTGAVYALIRVKSATICWRDDGTNPTNVTGMETSDGETIQYDGKLSAFKAIRRDGADATLLVNYYGPDS